MKRLWPTLSLLLILLVPATAGAAFPFDSNLLKVGGGNTSTPVPQKKTYTEEEINALKQQTTQELEQARQALQAMPESAPQEEGKRLNIRIQVLENLDLVAGDLLDGLNSQKKVQARVKDLETQEEQWKTGTPPKEFPLDFATLDKLRGQEVEAEKTYQAREQIFKSRQEALSEAKKDFESAEQARRQAKESAENSQDPAEKASLEQALVLAQLQSKVAEYRVALRELELETSKNYRDFFERQRSLNALQLAYLETRVKFTDEDLKREQNLLDEESGKINRRLEKVQRDLFSAQKEYDKAHQALDENSSPDNALIEEVEAKRLAQAVLEQENEGLNERLKQIKDLKDYWNRRNLLLNDHVEKPEIAVWQQQTRQYLEQIRRDEELSNLRLTSLRNNLVENEEKARAKVDADAETKRWLQAQRDSLQNNVSLMQDRLASLALTRKLYEKFLAEQDSRYAHMTFAERLSRGWERVVRVWNYEITSVDDSPITVSKVSFAVILMIFGLILAKRLSRALADRLLPRFGVAPGVAAALKTLMYYALVLLFVLTALHLVRVPLTLFAVLGGAVAIGIGFGSQNLMNNFISGLILLIERPIKMGDIVEMDGTAGIVEQIGGRSTQIRTFSNIHMIVPNSAFLEKSVTNWTLSDNMVRSSIRVGVNYGTSTRQVVDLLKSAAEAHGKILKNPEPIVLFSDFGNDALIFDLYFWLRIQTALERRVVESDLRFMVEGTFTEAGISMAFPQREMHLNSRDPIPIRILSDAPPEK